jgi:TetR/AcrR family transcriptional regulator, transcriptional repressor for nem operon
MGRQREFDVDEALDTAVQTFWERGFEAASIDDLTERTGLSRSSLYAAFGSKEQLFTSALARYLDRNPTANLEELELGTDGLDAIRRFFDSLVVGSETGATAFGCFGANTMAELGVRGERQRPLLDAYRARLNDAFATALRRAAAASEIDSAEIELRARALGTLALGLFLTLRGNPDAVREAREASEAVDAILRGWQQAPAAAN